MGRPVAPRPRENEAVRLPIWQELLIGAEIVCLRISPVYWGYGVPRGDGSAVVVIPAFMGTDLYLTEFRAWLGRIGYKPYYSGIPLNAECPNLLIRRHLDNAIQRAVEETGKKVHLIGHSLGGLMARAVATQMPDKIASVITMGSPFRGVSAHPSILRLAELVREDILHRNGENVLPNCYTCHCSCDFLDAMAGKIPRAVQQTAIYTKSDGIVDWRVCMTDKPGVDFEVSATHIGMAFNPNVYELVARRLAAGPENPVTPGNGRAEAVSINGSSSERTQPGPRRAKGR